MPGAGTGAITMSATLLFHCATCAFQTGPASQKTVSPSPPPFSNDMQTMSQAPRQLLPVRRGGGQGSDEARAEINRGESRGAT